VPEPDVERILREAERVAIVGYSTDPSRPSHEVAEYLHGQGYTVLPVNPAYAGEMALGEPIVASLDEFDQVDVVDVFRSSQAVPDHVDEAIRSGASVFWMQLGIENEPAAERLRAAGLTVVQDRCTAAEHLAQADH